MRKELPAAAGEQRMLGRLAKYISERNVLAVRIETGSGTSHMFSAIRNKQHRDEAGRRVRASWTIQVDVERMQDATRVMGMSVVDGMFVLKVDVRADINDDRLLYQLLVLRSGVYDMRVEERFAIRLGDKLVITRTLPEIILRIIRTKAGSARRNGAPMTRRSTPSTRAQFSIATGRHASVVGSVGTASRSR